MKQPSRCCSYSRTPIGSYTSPSVINVTRSFMANYNQVEKWLYYVSRGGNYGHAQLATSSIRNEATLTRKKCCYLIVVAALTPRTSWASQASRPSLCRANRGCHLIACLPSNRFRAKRHFPRCSIYIFISLSLSLFFLTISAICPEASCYTRKSTTSFIPFFLFDRSGVYKLSPLSF